MEGHAHTAVSYQGVYSGFVNSLWTKLATFYSLAALKVNKHPGKGNSELPDRTKGAFVRQTKSQIFTPDSSVVAALKQVNRR